MTSIFFHPDKPQSDRSRWICIYPAYINSKKTRAKGRLVPKEKAVENPSVTEMSDVLTAHGIRHGIENKQYSREPSRELMYRGRVRVHLKNDDGSLLYPNYPTRESIMLLLGDMIPKLKSRQGKPNVPEQPQPAGSSKKSKGKGKR